MVSVVITTMVVISVATPWFLVVVFPLLLIYRATQNFYIPASRQLKRIESNLRRLRLDFMAVENARTS